MILGPLWARLAVDGRYVLVSSTLMQEHHGFDVLLQGRGTGGKLYRDIKIDTKNIHGNYPNLFIEEESSTDYNTPGWLLKQDGWPDYIAYCFWMQCRRSCHRVTRENGAGNAQKIFGRLKYTSYTFQA